MYFYRYFIIKKVFIWIPVGKQEDIEKTVKSLQKEFKAKVLAAVSLFDFDQ